VLKAVSNINDIIAPALVVRACALWEAQPRPEWPADCDTPSPHCRVGQGPHQAARG